MAGMSGIYTAWQGCKHFSQPFLSSDSLQACYLYIEVGERPQLGQGPPGIPVPNSEFGVNRLYPPKFQSSSDLVSLREQGHLCVRDGTADGETSGG